MKNKTKLSYLLSLLCFLEEYEEEEDDDDDDCESDEEYPENDVSHLGSLNLGLEAKRIIVCPI